MLLLTIWKLGDNAYGVPVRERIVETTGRYWSIGAVYDVLDRLVRKGLIVAQESSPMAERGGKAKRYFTITTLGHEALEEVKTLHAALWSGLA